MWVVSGWLVLSAAFPYVYEGIPVWNFLVGHLIFGLALGLWEDWADRGWVRK